MAEQTSIDLEALRRLATAVDAGDHLSSADLVTVGRQAPAILAALDRGPDVWECGQGHYVAIERDTAPDDFPTCPWCQLRDQDSWTGLLTILDRHYPAEVFEESNDPGARIVTLARHLATARDKNERLIDLLGCFYRDDDPCSFDHHGGCQAHGFLGLQPGEKCPHHEIGELLSERRGGGS